MPARIASLTSTNADLSAGGFADTDDVSVSSDVSPRAASAWLLSRLGPGLAGVVPAHCMLQDLVNQFQTEGGPPPETA